MVDANTKKPNPRWWTVYGIVFVGITILIGVALALLATISFGKVIVSIALMILFPFATSRYMTSKPSKTQNRFMYIVVIGAFIGAITWFFIYLTRIANVISDVVGVSPTEDLSLVLCLIVSFAIGGVLGDLVGRHRNYKGPGHYIP